jgi:predicted nucleic acid-binding protein
LLAKDVLRTITSQPKHTFWPDDVSYLALPERGLRGHKQVTDYYLVALAGKNGGKLATMDEALAATFPDVCELI